MDAHGPLISVIIPTFNAEMVVLACLESIINQTYNRFEIIIQDGGSTDNTLKLIDDFKEKNKDIDISVFQERDEGIYDAMNKGIQKVHGEWIYFLGSDDKLYDSTVLAKVFLDDSNLANDVIYGNVYGTRFNGIYGGEFTTDRILDNNICHQGIFFKKDVFNKVGLYDLKFKGLADWDHNFKWFFSNEIKRKYVDIIVADYADGGFSSVKFDWVFEKERIIRYFSFKQTGLPFKKRFLYYKSSLRTALKTKDFIHLLKVISKTPAILFNV